MYNNNPTTVSDRLKNNEDATAMEEECEEVEVIKILEE